MSRNTKLPAELLLQIKEYIPHSDVRTHVCFYNTCRTTAAFYGDQAQQAVFWGRACALSGLGWLRADYSWKDIAFETIAKDGFCTHTHCGGALLDWNAKQVEKAMHLYGWDPEDGAWDADFDDEHAPEWVAECRPTPVCSPVFRFISFGDRPLPSWYTDPLDAHFLCDYASPWTDRSSFLTDHIVAARSLATFPGVKRIWYDFNNVAYGIPPSNMLGVTVWDVVRCIQHELDQDLSIQNLINLLSGPFADVFPDGRSSDFIKDLKLFSSLRGLWSVTRCQGLFFLRSTEEGPHFSSLFTRRTQNAHRGETSASGVAETEST